MKAVGSTIEARILRETPKTSTPKFPKAINQAAATIGAIQLNRIPHHSCLADWKRARFVVQEESYTGAIVDRRPVALEAQR